MSEGKHTFGEFKKFCKSADIKDLQKELRDKELDLFKMNARKTKGCRRIGYTTEDKGMPQIKTIHRQIAILKTYLNQKMLRNEKLPKKS